MAYCRVSYRDADGIEHAVDVQAASLYEAVAEAVARFRREDASWGYGPPPPRCELYVRVHTEAPVTHAVRLDKVEAFALHGTAKGPRDLLRKKKIQQLLGLPAE